MHSAIDQLHDAYNASFSTYNEASGILHVHNLLYHAARVTLLLSLDPLEYHMWQREKHMLIQELKTLKSFERLSECLI